MYAVINGLSTHSLYLALELLSLDARVLLLDPNWQNWDLHQFASEIDAKVFDRPVLEIIQELDGLGLIQSAEQVRCGKKHLVSTELAAERMKDLFRVSFQNENAKSVQAATTKNNAESMENSQLAKDFSSSLKMEREHFEDCDFVVSHHKSELKFLKDYLTVNLEILATEPTVYFSPFHREGQKGFEQQRIVIVGDCERSAQLILANQEWFFQLGHHLDLVTESREPFAKIKASPVYAELVEFFNRLEEFLNQEFESYRQYVFECRQQGRKADRVEPQETLSFFTGYSALVIDKLYDRPDYYLTLEKPDFRGGIDLKTVAAEAIYWFKDRDCQLAGAEINEEGLFQINEAADVHSEGKRIVENMMRYFSRND